MSAIINPRKLDCLRGLTFAHLHYLKVYHLCIPTRRCRNAEMVHPYLLQNYANIHYTKIDKKKYHLRLRVVLQSA